MSGSKFKDDPSLSDEEIAKIAAWTDAGGSLGNPADMPPPRQFAPGLAWAFGTPDLIVSSPTVTIKPLGADWHGDIGFTATGLTEDRFIRGVEIKEFRSQESRIERPAERNAGDLNYFVPHHAVVASERNMGTGEGGAADAQAGVSRRRGGLNIVYEVGQNAMIYPDDVGVLLPAGSNIYFPNVHLHSVGKPVPLQIQVGLWFHPKGYKPKYQQSASVMSIATAADDLDIPAGNDNVRFDGFYTMRQHGKMLNAGACLDARVEGQDRESVRHAQARICTRTERHPQKQQWRQSRRNGK